MVERVSYPRQTIVEILTNERLLLVGNRKHPIVAEAIKNIKPDSSGYRNLDITFLEQEEFIYQKPGQNLRLVVEQLFNSLNLVPKRSWCTSNMATAINIVSNSMAFTIMPEAGAKVPFLPDNLEFFSINQPEYIWELGAVYRKDSVLTYTVNHEYQLIF